MTWGATAIAGASLVSGAIGSRSADKQANLSKRQYNQTRSDLEPYREAGVNALNQYTGGIGGYNQDLPQYTAADYQQGGDFSFDLQNDPIYQNALNQSLKASSRAQSGLGGFNSGGRLAELAQVGARTASEYQNDAFNRQFASSRENFGRGITDYGIRQDRAAQDYNIASGQEQDLYGRNQNYLGQLQGLAGSGQNAANFTGQQGAQAAGQQIGASQFGAGSINNAIQGGIGNAMTYNWMNQNPYQPSPTNTTSRQYLGY